MTPETPIIPEASPLRWVIRYFGLAVIVTTVIGLTVVAVLHPAVLGAPEDGSKLFTAVAALVYLTPGIIVLIRSDWHPVGWLLCFLAVGFHFSFAPEFDPTAALGAWMVWLTQVSTSVAFWGVWSGLILVFPDRIADRSPSQRRLAKWVFVANAVALVVVSLQDRLGAGIGTIENPMPLSVIPEAIASQVYILPLLLVALVLVDFVRRYRQADPADRPQYRWVVWAFLYVGAVLPIAIATTFVSGNEDSPVWVLVVLGYILVPIGFMVSILRYRLYSIDKVVSRTLTYGVVVVLVGLIYTVPVVALAEVVGGSSDVVIAASTLVAAAAFSPIRRWAQGVVDRRFNRTKYDSEREVGVFAARLQTGIDFDGIDASLMDVLDATVQPTGATVWLRDPSGH